MNKRTSKQRSSYNAKAGKPPQHQGSLTYHKPLTKMSPEEVRTWIQGVRARLQQKMKRERDYLDRRAARGTHTPTDDSYEADQELEAELLELLDVIERDIAGK